MKLYDTLTRTQHELKLSDPTRVRIYVCGPTVYDVPHLGHARTAIVFDTLRRVLQWSELAVTFVANVTDVDDKIINRARDENSTEAEVAQRYEATYFDLMGRLGVLPPTESPHATAWIEPMIALIDELMAGGNAYVVEGQGVYFSVESYGDYGALSGRRLADLVEAAGARVELDERKASPVDFALWKLAKPGEPAWDSPWGPGRPGWHIECSAMSLGLLGEAFDLHGGGDDLVFPHHENERAQAEAAGHPFARHWMHSGMVIIRGEKMSKSLGNFVTLADVLDVYDPRAVRLLILQTHYRSAMEMGEAQLDQATRTLAGLDALARRAMVANIEAASEPDKESMQAFVAAMENDLGTPEALGIIFDAARRANQAIDSHDSAVAGALLCAVGTQLGILGLTLDDGSGAKQDADADGITALIDERLAARQSRNFAEADRIRDELAAIGVTLEDNPDGTTNWTR